MNRGQHLSGWFCMTGKHAVEGMAGYTEVRATVIDGEWMGDPNSATTILICADHPMGYDPAEAGVKAWLLDYAWCGTPDEQRREVDCIMAQDEWRHLSAVAEKFKGMAENPGDPKQMDEAEFMAISALYECHDGPHLDTCPHGFNRIEGDKVDG